MPTHYNVKMKMLYALAICGLVRRDDLAIFSETMNAGSHDIMDLISAGFVKESSAEVDIRIGGRSRKRVRRVCCITNKGLAFLLEFGGALFPWLESIPKSIIGNVNLRGGSEYGEAWHKAGMLENKQNVFDDFIAAAEYLIAGKYTSTDKLAIHGGSNGGLLVGACEVQRPDLYAVCLPAVGVMDMLRYHKFTIGWGWAVEYGSSEDEEQFSYIYKYSPLHNIKEGVKYPATLVTTADHDDRVVPAHSFKFAAAMQHAQAGDAPILIRIESKAGHGAGKPTSKRIDEAADMYAFLFQNIGVPYKVIKN